MSFNPFQLLYLTMLKLYHLWPVEASSNWFLGTFNNSLPTLGILIGAQIEAKFFRPFVCLAQCLHIVSIQQMVSVNVRII